MNEKLKQMILEKATEMYVKKETIIKVIELHKAYTEEGRVTGRGAICKIGNDDSVQETEIVITYNIEINNGVTFIDYMSIDKR